MDTSQTIMTFIGLMVMGVVGYYVGRKSAECKMNHTLSIMFISMLDYYETRPGMTKSQFLKYTERVVLSCAHDVVRSWAVQRHVGRSNAFIEETHGKPEAPPS